MKKILILFTLMILISACAPSNELTGDAVDAELTMFKSPNCGCCVGYAKYLKQQGFSVNVVPTTDMQSVKLQYNISMSMQSCHTLVAGDYFIEGHVPVEAIEKLLTEKPDVDGISLPGMPRGSPGMSGAQKEPFLIYSLKNGMASEFMIK